MATFLFSIFGNSLVEFKPLLSQSDRAWQYVNLLSSDFGTQWRTEGVWMGLYK